MHIGARSATVIAFAPGAPIVVEARGGYFRGHNRLRACSLARRGDLRRRGASPLLTLLCLFGAPFWVRSYENAGPSGRKLRPPSPVSHSKVIRMDGFVITSRAAPSLFLILNAPPSLSTGRVRDGVRLRYRPRSRFATSNLKAAPSAELLLVLMYAALRN